MVNKFSAVNCHVYSSEPAAAGDGGGGGGGGAPQWIFSPRRDDCEKI